MSGSPIANKRTCRYGSASPYVLALSLVLAATLSSAAPLVHSCHHSESARPLSDLPSTAVRARDGAPAAVVEALDAVSPVAVSRQRVALDFAAASPPAKEDYPRAQQLVGRGLRQLRFNISFQLDGACAHVGQTVSTYDGTGNSVTCSAADILTAEKRAYVRHLVALATEKLSSMLYARPTASILAPSTACTSVPTQETEYLDADFVLLVTAMPRATPGSTWIAWGRSCVRAANSGTGEGGYRPVIGQINFVPSGLRPSGIPPALEVRVTMHETTHALGFTSLYGTLSSYVDASGTRQSSGGTAIVYRPGLGKNVSLVRTPRVVAAARKHFGCSTLDGVEIEDMGGPGTEGSHWKQRIFFEEALVGVMASPSLFYSSVTLAFFEDAGFYAANYDLAEDDYPFGRNSGCPFLYDTCRSYTSAVAAAGSTNGDEFCFDEAQAKSSAQVCTQDRRGYGQCNIVGYSSTLPQEYQYFSDPKKGGAFATMDYCPVVTAFNNINCVAGSHTSAQENPLGLGPVANLLGNEYGPASRCLVSSLVTHSLPTTGKGPRCLPHACTSDGQLLLRVQGQTVRCPADGAAGSADTAALRGVHGAVECPPAADLCGSSGSAGSRVVSVSAKDLPLATNQEQSPVGACQQLLAKCTSELDLGALLPLCGRVAGKIRDCFGLSCALETSVYMNSHMPKLVSLCASTRTAVADSCADGWSGAESLCRLLEGV